MESERFATMEAVVDLDMKGFNPTQISKQLGIQRKVAIQLIDEYRTAISQDSEARDLARDHMFKMVKHYDALIKKSYELVEEIDMLNMNHQVAAQKNAAIKLIADLEAKRLDSLQKAGLLDSAELGDEMAELEEKHQIIIGIIKEDLCPACRQKIAGKVMKLEGKTDMVVPEFVDSEVVYHG